MPTPILESWSKIPASHLASPASRRAGPARALTIASALALVAGVGALLFSALRPLPIPEDGPAPQTIPSATFPLRAADLSPRERALDDLSAGNLFAYKRKPWAPAGTTPGDPAADPAADPALADAAPITPESSVPPELKQPYDNLRLVAVFETHAKPGAMISFVQGANPASATVLRVGDELLDPAHAQAKWKVLAIDPAARSVVLERAARRVELRLFKPAPGLVIEPVKAPDPNNPVVVGITREEAIQKLREAKINEADIQRLIELLGPGAAVAAAPPVPKPAPIDNAAAAEALSKVLQPADAKDAPPAGLEEVLKMMAKRRAEVTGNQTSPPQPKPEQAPPTAPPKP